KARRRGAGEFGEAATRRGRGIGWWIVRVGFEDFGDFDVWSEIDGCIREPVERDDIGRPANPARVQAEEFNRIESLKSDFFLQLAQHAVGRRFAAANATAGK